jgi:hypothetical protein
MCELVSACADLPLGAPGLAPGPHGGPPLTPQLGGRRRVERIRDSHRHWPRRSGCVRATFVNGNTTRVFHVEPSQSASTAWSGSVTRGNIGQPSRSTLCLRAHRPYLEPARPRGRFDTFGLPDRHALTGARRPEFMHPIAGGALSDVPSVHPSGLANVSSGTASTLTWVFHEPMQSFRLARADRMALP